MPDPATATTPRPAPPPLAHARAPRRRLSARVATVAGVEIRVHVTFLVLVALVALSSASEEGPGLAVGLLWLVGLFGCVVVHELAHSLVARRNAIPVTEIELLPIGGISKMERSPDDPRVELRIAVAGPAASVVLGVVFGSLAVLAGVSMWPPTLYGGGLLARLGWANLLLAAFNLTPALPLDGGRVLRAVLEEHLGKGRATHVAARVSRVFATLMMAAGLFFNIWLLLIGVFVYFGSWVEESAAALHEDIKDLVVRDIMIRDPMVLTGSMPTARATEAMWAGAQREFPVVDDAGRYLGLATSGDLVRADPRTIVAEVADAEAPVVAPDDPVEATGLLAGPSTAAAVIDRGRVVGLARGADATLVAQGLLERRAAASGQATGRS